MTDAAGTDLGTPGLVVDFESGTVIVSVGKDALGGFDIAEAEIAPLVGSEDNGALRPVAVEAGPFVFGGARVGAVENAPWIVDLLTPDGNQSGTLEYDAELLATIPFVSL